MRTTVLATEMARPRTMPSLMPSPKNEPAEARRRSHRYLDDGPRNSDVLDAQKVFHVEVKADAEHEEDDAELRQLSERIEVRLVAGRKGRNDDARGKVAHDRRQPGEAGGNPTTERETKGNGNGR